MSFAKRLFWAVLVLSVALPLAGLVSAAPAPHTAAQPVAQPLADGPNLLANPSFEIPFVKQCCQTDLANYFPNTPLDEVQVAQGWYGWWVEPNEAIGLPGSCEGWQGSGSCTAFHRPEWREAACGSAECLATRVRSGSNAQKYFTFYSIHDSGMWQRVTGVATGQRLRFSIYMMGWSTNENYGLSSGQQSMGMQVGIDPTGGTNPFSGNVIWGSATDTYDAWGLYTVEAVARSSAVTVFTRSRPVYPLQHNDIYLDDASLVVATGSSVGSGNSPRPTVTPIRDGVAYVVQPRDNYYRIARKFGLTVEALLAANPTVNANLLRVGQTIILPGVTQAMVDAANASTAATPAPNNNAPRPTATPISGTPYVVQAGDNFYRIARKFNIPVDLLLAANPTVNASLLRTGQTILIPNVNGAPAVQTTTVPTGEQVTYVVQPNDNLWRIAKKFSTTVERLRLLNNLTTDIVQPGQVLIVGP